MTDLTILAHHKPVTVSSVQPAMLTASLPRKVVTGNKMSLSHAVTPSFCAMGRKKNRRINLHFGSIGEKRAVDIQGTVHACDIVYCQYI